MAATQPPLVSSTHQLSASAQPWHPPAPAMSPTTAFTPGSLPTTQAITAAGGMSLSASQSRRSPSPRSVKTPTNSQSSQTQTQQSVPPPADEFPCSPPADERYSTVSPHSSVGGAAAAPSTCAASSAASTASTATAAPAAHQLPPSMVSAGSTENLNNISAFSVNSAATGTALSNSGYGGERHGNAGGGPGRAPSSRSSSVASSHYSYQATSPGLGMHPSSSGGNLTGMSASHHHPVGSSGSSARLGPMMMRSSPMLQQNGNGPQTPPQLFASSATLPPSVAPPPLYATATSPAQLPSTTHFPVFGGSNMALRNGSHASTPVAGSGTQPSSTGSGVFASAPPRFSGNSANNSSGAAFPTTPGAPPGSAGGGGTTVDEWEDDDEIVYQKIHIPDSVAANEEELIHTLINTGGGGFYTIDAATKGILPPISYDSARPFRKALKHNNSSAFNWSSQGSMDSFIYGTGAAGGGAGAAVAPGTPGSAGAPPSASAFPPASTPGSVPVQHHSPLGGAAFPANTPAGVGAAAGGGSSSDFPPSYDSVSGGGKLTGSSPQQQQPPPMAVPSQPQQFGAFPPGWGYQQQQHPHHPFQRSASPAHTELSSITHGAGGYENYTDTLLNDEDIDALLADEAMHMQGYGDGEMDSFGLDSLDDEERQWIEDQLQAENNDDEDDFFF